MDPKKLVAALVGDSSSSAADDDDDESGSDTSDDDEFDSSDDRVNQIPAHASHPQEASSDEEESSSSAFDSESEESSGSAFKDSSRGTALSSPHSTLQEPQLKCSPDDTGMEEDAHSFMKIITAADVSTKTREKAAAPNTLQNGDRSGSKHQTGQELVQIPGPSRQRGTDSSVASSGKSESLVRNRHDDTRSDKMQSVKRRKGDNDLETERRNHLVKEQYPTGNGDLLKPARNMDAVNEISTWKTEDNISAALPDRGLTSGKKWKMEAESQGKQEKAHGHLVKELRVPLKPNSKARMWSSNDELVLTSQIWNHVKRGMLIPNKKNDEFWVRLSETIKENLGLELSCEQLTRKFRGMRQKYQTLAKKVNACQNSKESYKHRSLAEQRLFNMWNEIWGKSETAVPEDKEDSVVQVSEHHIAVANGKQDCSSPGICGFDTLAVQKIIRDEMLTVANILKDKVTERFEDLENRVMMIVEDSANRQGNQSKLTPLSRMGMGALHLNADIMCFEPFLEDPGFHQQWCDLQLQKLDIDARKLQIMQEECDLKQELLKLQLQQGQKNQK